MGIPQARWMVYFMENPNLKWMIQTPIYGNPPCGLLRTITGMIISINMINIKVIPLDLDIIH